MPTLASRDDVVLPPLAADAPSCPHCIHDSKGHAYDGRTVCDAEVADYGFGDAEYCGCDYLAHSLEERHPDGRFMRWLRSRFPRLAASAS